MDQSLRVYNTLDRAKTDFVPINPPHVGMYVCGPTVYGDAHLGHARPAVTYDVVHRWLLHSGYKVRFVRNITDVGHLENDADEGQDKIAKKARLEQVEPMEIVQRYTDRYHEHMRELNCLPPAIEPRASGHIIEQIEMTKAILAQGFAYEVNGSVYFNVEAYNKSHHYGKLSGRKLEDLIANTRELEGQGEKKHPADFALWKRAAPEHIMRWPSPWGEGFPGWHLECSVMSSKYLGEQFDIHGGGMDLLFPHHECEIAQSNGANGVDPVRYWIHNNMITINGQKMGKSLGNFITLRELFTGNHDLLLQPYSPMTVRFFMLQAHYRSTLDFSNGALQAAGKGLERLLNAAKLVGELQQLEFPESGDLDAGIEASCQAMANYMNDDFSTPQVVAELFELSGHIHALANGQVDAGQIGRRAFKLLHDNFKLYVFDILGLQAENKAGDDKLEGLMQLIIGLRNSARENKDYLTSDRIRDELAELGISLKDGAGGTNWSS